MTKCIYSPTQQIFSECPASARHSSRLWAFLHKQKITSLTFQSTLSRNMRLGMIQDHVAWHQYKLGVTFNRTPRPSIRTKNTKPTHLSPGPIASPPFCCGSSSKFYNICQPQRPHFQHKKPAQIFPVVLLKCKGDNLNVRNNMSQIHDLSHLSDNLYIHFPESLSLSEHQKRSLHKSRKAAG